MNDGRNIVGIEWYSHRPGWHELTFDDGDYQRVPGNLDDAAALAETLELALAPAGEGVVRWERRDS